MGRYLHLYETASNFEADYNGTAYTEPWVSLTEQNGDVNYNKKVAVTEFTVSLSPWSITIQEAGVTCEDLAAENSGNTYPGLMHVINTEGCEDATFEGEFQYDEYGGDWWFSCEIEDECYMFGTVHMHCSDGEIYMHVPV